MTPDPKLANIGVEQAKKAGKWLHSEVKLRPDAVLCSGLTRAVETALFAFGPSSPYKVNTFITPYKVTAIGFILAPTAVTNV